MAYVAISNSLMDEVRSKIGRMKEAELDSLPKAVDTLTFSDAPHDFQKLVWGDHFHLKDTLPDSWKRYVPELIGFTEFSYKERTMKSRLYIKLANKFGSPPDQNSSYSYSFAIPETHPDVAPVIEYIKQTTEVSDKWSDIRSKVTAFLQNCKSLNEAVKLWPDVRIYIPQSYMDRMLVKSERTAEKISKATEFLKQIDTDAAVAAAVGARMAGARL